MKSGLNTYRLAFVILFVLISQQLSANNDVDLINTNFQIDFRSIHTWRGFAANYSPTIEPSFEVSRSNTTTGIWFAQSLDGNYSELDLYLSYTLKAFSFTIYDYYCPPSIQASNEITNYNKFTTNHTIELDLSFNGTEKLPIKILVATMIYGDDIHSETNENNYSTYVQLGYSTQIDENTIDMVLGFNTFESYYGNQFGVVNAGVTASRNVKAFNTKEIPVQASLITNPLANTLFLTFGFTL